MKNFEYAEEQKLIRKIWKIHDEIFSIPAKKFILHFTDVNMGGGCMLGYEYLKNNNQHFFDLEIIYDNSIPKLNFGDMLLVIKIQKLEKCTTNITYEKKENICSIVITTDFLHYRQMITTLGDCVKDYKYKKHNCVPKITQLTSLEVLIRNRMKGK